MTWSRSDILSAPMHELTEKAATLRDTTSGAHVSFSPKVFLPLTHLCRDQCRYCVFARPPQRGQSAYMSPDDAVETARRGAALGAREALFTLGDAPEDRWPQARAALDEMGFASTLDYVAHVAERVLEETGLLPHVNAGILSLARLRSLRRLSPSMGMMLETVSPRLMQRGEAHYRCPDKDPAVRLQALEDAGRAQVPFTTGILIGIGETRDERLDALDAISDLHRRYGHIQEVIVQPFRAKPKTAMSRAPEPGFDELAWTIAAARLMLGAEVNIQSPPNLVANDPQEIAGLIDAGINDFGGVSPLTPDYVNPEAPWPHIGHLAEATAAAGKRLVERLTIYPAYIRDSDRWVDPAVAPRLRAMTDAAGRPRDDDWRAGVTPSPPRPARIAGDSVSKEIESALGRVMGDGVPREGDIAALFDARGTDVDAVVRAADEVRGALVGDEVSYVVTRNINYTNVCTFACGFCAFSKGKVSPDLRDAPYLVDLDEIGRRAAEAWARGASEVCLQGGIHPSFTGETYIAILDAVRDAAPGIHMHAFSPLEVSHGAASLGISAQEFLTELKAHGLRSLPGTAAEILDDEVRRVICPDKLTTDEWLGIVGTAHKVGLRTTSTIMFGHVDRPVHWARHLLRLRALQARTGGLTEFVPLPFVADEAPIFRRGQARAGPTWREAILMQAVARLTLAPLVANIQASWVKLGPEGAVAALAAGSNDFGGTLMSETITRSAGARHGGEMTPQRIETLIREAGRRPRLRTTLYDDAPAERRAAAFAAGALDPQSQRPAGAARKGQRGRAALEPI